MEVVHENMWAWFLQVAKMNGFFIFAKTIMALCCVIYKHLFGLHWSKLASPGVMQMMEMAVSHARGAKEPVAMSTSASPTSIIIQALGGVSELLFLTKQLHAMAKGPLSTMYISHSFALSVSEFDNNDMERNNVSDNTMLNFDLFDNFQHGSIYYSVLISPIIIVQTTSVWWVLFTACLC